MSEVQKIEEKYGSTLREPATKEKLKRMIHAIKEKFNGLILPEPYIEFLYVVNGLECQYSLGTLILPGIVMI